MVKEKIKNEVIQYLIQIQTMIVEIKIDSYKILLLENFKKLKVEFLKFFTEFEKESYKDEYFLINTRRINRFFKKKLLIDIILFLDKLKKDKKLSKKTKRKFHIKFLVFVN